MAPPQLSDYESAATAIYAPQQQAEAESLQATDTTTKATLEAEKPQIETDYQSAIDKLTSTVQSNAAKIDQLYSERLGGNFSGLEGNDMGQMFATADQDLSIISETEANKLAAITTAEGNADITYQADLDALTPKYQSEEEQYAETNYAAAVKEYNTTNYENAELELKQESINNSAANTETSAENALAASYKATGKSATTANTGTSNISSTSNGYNFTGPNNQPINMAQYVLGASGGSSNTDLIAQTTLNLLQNGSSYDQAIYNQVKNLSGTQLLSTIAQIDAKGTVVNGKKIGGANAYGF